MVLFEHATKREIERLEFQIKIHGGKIEKKKEEQEGWFKDPAEYEHLSQEEREALTQDMMKKHKVAATDLMMRRP